MTAICTNTEVFDFMSTGTEERTANGTAVTNLISRVEYEIEQYIGRKVSSTSFSIKIHDGRYCNIQGNLLFLKDIYYDTYSITELLEGTTELVEDTDFVRTEPNILERIDAWWDAADQLNISITGSCGLVYNAGTEESPSYLALPDIKQIAIEETAVRSGLWTKIIDDGQGNEFAVNKSSLSKGTQDRLNRYVLPIV